MNEEELHRIEARLAARGIEFIVQAPHDIRRLLEAVRQLKGPAETRQAVPCPKH